MKTELNIKKKVLALERRKAQFDALIRFIKAHPHAASEATLCALRHRTGLYFCDFAIIRPVWKNNKPALRLEKSTEDWSERFPNDLDPFDFSNRTVCEDVSRLSDTKLLRLLDKVHRELIPEDFDDE
jgi:hypothetical protein